MMTVRSEPARIRRLRATLTVGIAASVLIPWFTVTLIGSQSPSEAMSQSADAIFKNVQILKGLSVDQFMSTMGFFSASLGLNCTDCHIEESGGNWAKYADDNNRKRMARRMMQMVNSINQTNFGGRQVVSCNTCHRGNPRPNVMPSLDQLYGSPPPDEPGDPIQQVAGQPSIDQLVDKYLEALGGRERVEALSSFTAKGTYMAFDDADKSPLEMYAKAPDQYSIVAHAPSGDTTWTIDGRSAWIAAPPTDRPVPVLTVTGSDLDGVKLEAAVFFPTRIRQALSNWRTGVPATLNGREVRVAQGTSPGGATVTVCFDAESGLLTRLVWFSNTPVGRVVTRVDYSDYRELSGVKIPHKWTVIWLNGRSTYELMAVQPNVPVDAVRFGKPR